MKSWITFLGLTLTLTLASSCSNSSGVSGIDAAQSRPEWSLELKSTCSDISAENCLAGYTYSVGADGSYHAGPGPQGQTLTGKLSESEFAQLQALYLESVGAARPQEGDAPCAPSVSASEASESQETIRAVSRSGSATEWIRTEKTQTCSRLSTPSATQNLLGFLRDSAAAHYPLPFPDDSCDGATATLETLYGNARACKIDSDCAFIDDSFETVPNDHFTFLVTKDCTGATPLVVGNLSYVASKRAVLLQALSHAKEACQKRATSTCDGFSDFQPTDPAPVCRGGLCRARRG